MGPKKRLLSRHRARLRRIVERKLWLRWHMATLLGLAVAGGALVNVVLYRLGVASMPLRYVAACAASYAGFLLLVRLWLGIVTRSARGPRVSTSGPDALDAAEVGADVAQAVLDDAGARGAAGIAESAGAPSWDGLDLVPDVDGEGLLVATVAIGLLLLAGGAFYLLWFAPAILAEAAVNVVLATVLARSSRGAAGAPGWLPRLARSTLGPFALTTVVLVALGAMLQALAPGASRLVDVVAFLRS